MEPSTLPTACSLVPRQHRSDCQQPIARATVDQSPKPSEHAPKPALAPQNHIQLAVWAMRANRNLPACQSAIWQLTTSAGVERRLPEASPWRSSHLRQTPLTRSAWVRPLCDSHSHATKIQSSAVTPRQRRVQSPASSHRTHNPNSDARKTWLAPVATGIDLFALDPPHTPNSALAACGPAKTSMPLAVNVPSIN